MRNTLFDEKHMLLDVVIGGMRYRKWWQFTLSQDCIVGTKIFCAIDDESFDREEFGSRYIRALLKDAMIAKT